MRERKALEVKLRCPACDEGYSLIPPWLTLRVCRCLDEDWRDFVMWTCPMCETPVARTIHPVLAESLITGGVPGRPYRMPDEIRDAARVSDEPALDEDDALDFCLALRAWDGQEVA